VCRGQAIWNPTFNNRFTFPLTGVYIINVQLDIQNLTAILGDPFSGAPIGGYCELALGDFNASTIHYKTTIGHGNDSSSNHFESLHLSVNTYIQAGETWYIFVRFPNVPADRVVYARADPEHSRAIITYIH
jgi:hypothetical protein